MIDHRIRFRENDDLPRRGPVVKKKPPFSNARSNHVGMRNAILGNDLVQAMCARITFDTFSE